MTATVRSASEGVAAVIDGAPISGFQARIILLCSLATFFDGYDVQALGLAIPHMAAGFGIAPTAFAPALSASLAGMALGAILLGPLGDRYGRRRMLIAMMLLIAGTTFGAMMSSGPVELAVWRLGSGLGLGGTVPIAIATTSEYTPARRRGALVTLVVACTALGSFAAGMIAPAVEARFGWRGIFGLGAILPLIAAALLWLGLPESLRFLAERDPANPDVARQLARIDGSASYPHRQHHPHRSMETKAPPRGSLAGLFSPTLRFRTLLLWIGFWLNLFANYSLISWLPTLLGSAGWSPASASRATGLLALGGIVGGIGLALLADRGRMVPSLVTAYAGAALVFGTVLFGVGTGPGWLFLIALAGAGAFGGQMALGSLSAAFYPPEIRSTGLGWSGGIGRIGAIFGPVVLAALMTRHVAPTVIIGLLMVPMIGCAICVSLLPRALRPSA